MQAPVNEQQVTVNKRQTTVNGGLARGTEIHPRVTEVYSYNFFD